MMESIRKWFYRPKRDDTSLLAQFFYANEALTAVACELDSFDGRQEPERCTTLVNQLRHCQDKVLTICNQIMDQLIPDSRANRDFRVKFPDDVMQENLAGQLWFGAECLAAGSSIMNREVESSAMRPLAKALTKSLEIVRNLLREHALKGHMNLKEMFQAQNPLELEKVTESLKIFDRLFADFELCYVAAMVPVKSTKEYEQQELVCVLFSETLQRALERGLLNQADVDNYEPALMFTIPRLAIVSGLLAPPGGPLCLNSADSISEMFRPFRNLLLKIRELLWTLNNRELYMLEKLLCSNEEPSVPISQTTKTACHQDLEEFVHNFYTDYPNCKDFVDFYTVTKNTGTNMDHVVDDAVEIFDENTTKVEYLIQRKLLPQRIKDQERREKKPRETPVDYSVSACPHNHSLISVGEQAQTETILSNFEENSQDDSGEKTSEVTSRLAGTSQQSQSDTSPSSSGSVALENKFDDSLRTNEDNFFSTDISQMLGATNNIEIPQTQYLLNQVSHENNVTGDGSIQIDNSLPDMDSRQLISEANKTLSTLLLEGECPNEISEQTDSGICTVVSSENTSLYDKSPEEKKTFAHEIESSSQRLPGHSNCEDIQESTEQNDTETSKIPCRISANFNGTNEEFVGLAYGNGQITVCDSNHSSIQINYSDNWENLNLNIDASAPTKEFWRDFKCKNCPSTSGDINRIGRITTANKSKEHKLKKRHQRKFDKKISKRSHDDTQTTVRNARLSLSTQSSRSNSTDGCLNSRLGGFSASLHPSQNTRRMPNFGSHSPQPSPRLCHFESRSDVPLRNHNFGHRASVSESPHNRKLLDHRRSRSEQIAKMRKRDNDNCVDLPNDGLGRRIDKSGLITGATTSPKSSKPAKSINPKGCATVSATMDADSTSSCSSYCDSSSETSEFQSDCQDDEEIALAMQAAEIANRNQIRAKFRSSEDLVHRLFVCIAGVADQLQTNFASDLRNILKCVFLMNSSQVENGQEPNSSSQSKQSDVTVHSTQVLNTSDNVQHRDPLEEEDQDIEDTASTNETTSPVTERGEECVERAPAWVPDNDAPRCMACQAGFTVVRRRHHCRNCGKVFCGRCSSNNVALPRYGHTKPVRVCNRCFLYQVTPFTVSHVTPTS